MDREIVYHIPREQSPLDVGQRIFDLADRAGIRPGDYTLGPTAGGGFTMRLQAGAFGVPELPKDLVLAGVRQIGATGG